MKGKSVRELIAGPLRDEELHLTIAEMFQGDQWNWNRISFNLPREIKEQICATPMQLWGEKEDTMMWKFTRDGEFSTASAYAQLKPESTENQIFEGHWIWKLNIWPKIMSFGYASMIVYPSNKSLPREELVVKLDAHYVGMEMSH